MKRKYDINDCFFNSIDTEAKAYILGLLWADGYVYKKSNSFIIGLTLHVNDKELMEDVLKEMSSNNTIKYHSDNCISFSIYSNIMFDDLVKLNVVNRKTYANLAPVGISDDLIHHFIRGIFDGDGCICNSGGNTTFSIANTINTCEWIKSFLLCGSISKKSNSDICYSYTIGGKLKVQNLFSYLYKDATIYLKRKYNKFLDCGFVPDLIVEDKLVKTWTDSEIDLLYEKFPSLPDQELIVIFNRPIQSIIGKARRLKIKKSELFVSNVRRIAANEYNICSNFVK